MVRFKEKPLTTQALNRFLETVQTEVAKTSFAEDTRHNILSDVAGLILPVDTPPGHEELGYEIDVSIKKLPTTLSELQQRVNRATSGFYKEPSAEAANKLFRAILDKAFRAAEKDSERGR